MGRTNHNVSRASFVVDLESLDFSAGYFINWDLVTATNANGDKEIKAGAIVALKGGGAVPRTDANDVALASATEAGGTATYTATADHGYSVGDIVSIAGFATAGYNVSYVKIATVPSATTFTIDGIAGAPADDAGGGTASSPAVGILFEGITAGDKARALNGQSVLKGGVLYDSLLPDSGEADFEAWKTELNDNLPRGFQWESYADNRS